MAMEIEAIITGLIIVDVTATLAGNYIIRGEVRKFSDRLLILETQHRQNHQRQNV